MQSVDDPYFRYFEHQYLMWTYQTLTRNWAIIQGDMGRPGMSPWKDIFESLELVRKAQMDLLLLAHMGIVGRTASNKILWGVVSLWALFPEYEDLSHKVSTLVNQSRKHIERPPAKHRDRGTWS